MEADLQLPSGDFKVSFLGTSIPFFARRSSRLTFSANSSVTICSVSSFRPVNWMRPLAASSKGDITNSMPSSSASASAPGIISSDRRNSSSSVRPVADAGLGTSFPPAGTGTPWLEIIVDEEGVVGDGVVSLSNDPRKSVFEVVGEGLEYR